MDINASCAQALDNDEPIEIEGYTLYPIKMGEYRRFEAVKNAILIRQSALPAKYAVKRYLAALYAMDYDALKETGKARGFIGGVLAMLSLSMRFPADAIRQMPITTSDADERELVSLNFRVGDMIYHLTPALFDRLRPILAAQNGLEIPDETENVDLVEAENDIAAAERSNLKYDFRTLIASVARDQRCRRSELMDYTIREFMDLRDAIERDKLYMLYQTAELSGTVKFQKGNPVPSWCYNREKSANSLISMADFMAGPGSVAATK